MPIADIVREIDAYLLCLREARDLLSTPVPVTRPERANLGKKKVKRKKTAPAVSSRPRIQKSKSRSNGVVRRRKKVEARVDPDPSPLARPAADAEQSPVAATPLALQGTVEKEVSSKNKQNRPTTFRHRRRVRQTLETKPEKVKPATVLAVGMSSRVVVVSAEELKRERELAANPEVRRPRLPAAGLSGRLAFEALFKD